LTDQGSRPAFQRFVRALFGPLFQEIGFTSTTVDSDERRALRATLIATMGTTGDDEQGGGRARAALEPGACRRSPARRDALAIDHRRGRRAAETGRCSDALLAASERATSPDERYRYLYALAEFRDPALIDRALEYSLTSKLRSQDTSAYFARFFANEGARPRAWAFLKQHWAELEPKLTIFGGDTTVNRRALLVLRCGGPRRHQGVLRAASPARRRRAR